MKYREVKADLGQIEYQHAGLFNCLKAVVKHACDVEKLTCEKLIYGMGFMCGGVVSNNVQDMGPGRFKALRDLFVQAFDDGARSFKTFGH